MLLGVAAAGEGRQVRMDRKRQTSLWLQSRPIAAIRPQVIRRDEMKSINVYLVGAGLAVVVCRCCVFAIFFFPLVTAGRR